MRLFSIYLILFISLFNVRALAIQLEFPLDCELGNNCWISNLPRHYWQNKEVDFRCGPNTYRDHKGTDFALRDYKQMQNGVKVLAPFDGVVRGLRDNVLDISVKDVGKDTVKGVECGNGLVISSGEYEAQLCHLKKNFLTVTKGQSVKAGEVLGLVGLSGNTEYPHLHMSLRKNSREIDPFYGDLDNCGLSPLSMWKNVQIMDKHAKTGVVYNYGFTFKAPNAKKIRSGEYTQIQPDRPGAIVGFVDIFSVNKGDEITLYIIDSSNATIIKRKHNFSKYQARYFFFVGKKLRRKKLYGQHTLVITYKHSKGGVEKFTKDINL